MRIFKKKKKKMDVDKYFIWLDDESTYIELVEDETYL